MVMSVTGAASSATGAYYGAQSQKQQLEFQSGISGINAKSTRDMADINLESAQNTVDINSRMAETAAQQTLLTGQREEQKSRIATANLKGTQRAQLAANGVDLGEGSAANVLTSTDLMGEIDAKTIQSNAVRSAWGYRTQSVLDNNAVMTSAISRNGQALMQAGNYDSQAATSRASAGAVNPGSSAFTSLLGNAGSVASSWYQYTKNDIAPDYSAFKARSGGNGR
jgi:hypothetical protein